MRQALKMIRRIILAIAVVLTLVVLWVFTPMWATPVAKLWYEPGFEDAVADALVEIPNSENACIYDDTRHMFVTSVAQLDVERMVENAVRDKAPIPRTHQRNPHFRIYNGRNTFYWSFRDQELHAFWGDRWTLSGTGKRLCEAYMNTPEEYRSAFEGRNGMVVSEANFCCIAGQDF